MESEVETFIGYGITLSDSELGKINSKNPTLYELLWGDLPLSLSLADNSLNTFFFGKKLFSTNTVQSFLLSQILVKLTLEEKALLKEVCDLAEKETFPRFYLILDIEK